MLLRYRPAKPVNFFSLPELTQINSTLLTFPVLDKLIYIRNIIIPEISLAQPNTADFFKSILSAFAIARKTHGKIIKIS